MHKKEYLELKDWFDTDGKNVVWDLMNKWREKLTVNNDIIYIFARAFFDEEKISSIRTRDVKSINILFERIDSKYMEFIQEARKKLSNKELKSVILNFDELLYFEGFRKKDGLNIPKGVKKLIYALLDIQEEDRLFQPYSLEGDFLVDFILEYPEASISGVEIKTDNVLISELKALIIEGDCEKIKIYQGEYINLDLDKVEYNKVFSMPPMSVRSKYLKEKIESKDLINLYGENNFQIFDDWANILKLILNPKFDRALFIVPSGLLFNERDKNIRKYLLENGFIEGIIELPARIFMGTSISTNIILISKNNETVKMVDASALYKKDRTLNNIDGNNLREILDAYNGDSEISKAVNLKKLEEYDYSLIPRRYTNEELNIENYVYLKDVVNIKRGYANLKQSELNERLSDSKTNIKILTAGDINDDFNIEELSSLKNIEASEDVYCVDSGDTVFARGGTYKSLLIRNKGEEKIIANGTLYIITCDKDKMNPYYLQMYLASDHCLIQIDSLNAGTSIPFMSIKQLGELKIPKVTKDIEEAVAKKYKMILDQKEVIRIQKKRLEEDITDLISEVL